MAHHLGLRKAGQTNARPRLQRAKATGGQIAGDAAHAQSIGAVRGDLDVDHRVNHIGAVLGQPIGKAFAHLA
jgi:hypothetical protein